MFNWLTDFFRVRRDRLRTRAPHIERVAAHNSHFLNPPLDIHSARVYAGSPWVYIAINRIAEAGALVPLKVSDSTGADTALTATPSASRRLARRASCPPSCCSASLAKTACCSGQPARCASWMSRAPSSSRCRRLARRECSAARNAATTGLRRLVMVLTGRGRRRGRAREAAPRRC